MRILVTGAEGLVGSAVVARLRAAGHELTTLTLPDATPHEGVRVVRGDARDADAVREAATGVDRVAHLAAIPSPDRADAPTVFGNNSTATFTVLWTAAELGVRRFAIAGSVNAAGLIMNPALPLPPAYPIDETIPPDIADPYSLSKLVDEYTLRAVCRRFPDTSGVAFRLPLMLSDSNRADLVAWQRGRPASTLGDGWGWLDVRDAGEAFLRALTGEYAGAHVLQVAAPTTIQATPTDELLDRYAPGVPRRTRFPGTTAPVDTSRARDLLGFVPTHTNPEGA